MTATFLLTLDLESADPSSRAATADDIHAILDPHFDVREVKPWSQHNVAPITTPVVAPPTVPPPVV